MARRVIIGIGIIWAVVGLLFAGFGAWPVMPFLGLEVLILAVAFAMSNRASRAEETINLTATTLTVRRIDHWGKQTLFKFPTSWLQVNLDSPLQPQSRLELRSHGKSISIGGFLGPTEKFDLARTLRRQLDRHARAALPHADVGLT